MAEETQIQDAGNIPTKRKLEQRKGGKGKKKLKVYKGSDKKVKISQKMRKQFAKKAREYNSDDDDDEEEEEESTVFVGREKDQRRRKKEIFDDKHNGDRGDNHDDIGGEFEISDDEEKDVSENEVSEDEDGEIQPGIMKFAGGCKAFKMAFWKITKRSASDDVLGPVLSVHKKLIAEKLAEEDVERKVKGEAKKEKHMVKEKGHVQPANFLDTHDKFLLGIATKGVVKLFNAVNKAQNAQRGLNPERSKDAKVLKKRRKEAFFSELSRMPSKATEASSKADGEGPSWAPLRDNFMLTNSKLKDWDKMQDTNVADDTVMPTDSSSDDED